MNQQRSCKGRNQNSELVTHIKGRLMKRIVILINCVPFQNGTSLKGKNSLQRSEFFSLRADLYGMGKNDFPY